MDTPSCGQQCPENPMQWEHSRDQWWQQVSFNLDGGTASGNGAPAGDAVSMEAQQTAKRPAPKPKKVTLDAIEKGIRWPQPTEEAFWERSPRTEPVSLGG